MGWGEDWCSRAAAAVGAQGLERVWHTGGAQNRTPSSGSPTGLTGTTWRARETPEDEAPPALQSFGSPDGAGPMTGDANKPPSHTNVTCPGPVSGLQLQAANSEGLTVTR